MQHVRSDPVARLKPIVVFAVLALALALRLLHLSSALKSPLSYQPGPDEDYYQRFGASVASGLGADAAEFTFMDPGYGYLLGAVFKLTGVNPFAVYFLQALVDTATALGIIVAGGLLRRPLAGLWGALLYALTSSAIMFCATLLKESWVAAFVIWWVVSALALYRFERNLAWLAFGVFCGVGMALRSTLSLLGLVGLLLPALCAWADSGCAATGPPAARVSLARHWIARAALCGGGMLLASMPWTIRNYRAFEGLSPVPHNGGIVLHQAYNADNPQSVIWIPPFVNYSHPSDIWRGYAAEASRRTGEPMLPTAVNRYWQSQALEFMRLHPGQVLADMGRKSLSFLAATEVPNNRSTAEERLFSPVLALLPPPMPWLLSMGLAGLVWFARQDRRWPVLAAPIAVAWFTMAAFWAEDRFRFHASPVLALCAGVWIDAVVAGLRDLPRTPSAARPLMAYGLLATLILGASLRLGALFPPPSVRWDHVVWGYIKMGRNGEAQALAVRVVAEQPDNAPIVEALGYLAAAARHYEEAARDFEHAVALRPRSYLAHFNLAKSLLALGRRSEASVEAQVALSLNPSPDALALIAQIAAP